MQEVVLELKGIRKIFNKVVALDDVDLVVKKGEVHVILGENGAGKSTLVNVLGGVFQANSGSIFINSKKVTIHNTQQAFALGIYIVFQETNLFDHYSIGENLFIGTILNKRGLRYSIFSRINTKRLIERAQRVLDELGFELDASVKVGKLNFAQKRMVEIARAFSTEARIIVMDEPTSSISQKEKDILYHNFNVLKKRGVSIILVTQLLQDVISVADNITILRDGVKQATFSKDEFETEKVIKWMSGEDYRNRYPKLNTLTNKVVFETKNLNSKILTDINIKLHKGEILGITGLVGSGRSSLAKYIFGYEKFREGSILINQKEVNIKSPSVAMKYGIAYIPDDRAKYGVFKNMSILDNLLSNQIPFLRNILISWSEQRDTLDGHLEMLDIKASSTMDSIEILSEGNKQKVMLLKWLSKDANIFIFDEPTAGIDTTSKVDIYNLMADLLRKGASIILLTSDINELLGLSDRILIMNKGAIIKTLESKDTSIEEIYEYLVKV